MVFMLTWFSLTLSTSFVSVNAGWSQPGFNILDFYPRGGGGTWVFFGWVFAARNSKLAPRSKKNSPKIDTPF